jgi:hypothetical protein
MTAYTGYLTRSAHYAYPGDRAPGVNPEHEHPDPDPDPFSPVPDTPVNQAGDVWNPQETGFASDWEVEPVTHWFNGAPAVPSSVPYGTAQQAMQDRMMNDHSVIHYVPDSIRLYQHQSEGVEIDWFVGRAPQNAGVSLPDDVAYLANGDNSYDQINQPNPDVYGGDEANVGRYRLGHKVSMFGLYDTPLGKFGQDASLHAYTGLTPQFPAQKNQMTDGAAPYTPNSSGTATWTMPQFQVPKLFSLPSETSITDYTTAAEESSTDSGFTSEDGPM